MTDNDSDDAGLVRLMHHDARWKQEFEQTRSGLFQCSEGRINQVHHIGSTAISGLIARPVIDVVATVEALEDFEDAALCIEGLNFRRVTPPVWAKSACVLIKPRHGDPTHRVLLAFDTDPLVTATIAVRDHLRGYPEVALRFEETKVEQWRQGDGDHASYEAEKSLFFQGLHSQLGLA
ncbi:MAG: GrpB family protein [Planctomycetota bacterium]